MRTRKKVVKRLMNLSWFLFVMVLLVLSALSVTNASPIQTKANAKIDIDRSGNKTCEGDLLGKDLWYPGKEEIGIIRVTNNYKKLDSCKLNLSVNISKWSNRFSEGLVYDSFINNMKLTVKKGSAFIFQSTIIDDKTLNELITNGIDLSAIEPLDKGKSIDFQYTLKMDENAGDELENMAAKVNLTINTEDKQGGS